MKLRTTALALAVAAASNEALAFTTAPSSRAFVTAPSFVASPAASSTSLNALGLGKLFKRGSAADTDSTEDEIRGLFYLWNDALATGDSRIVASRYASDAVLLPTVSDTPRTDYRSIKDYFDAFLKRKPQGEIVEGYIKIGNGIAQDTGIYEFTMGDDGSKVKARYSYIYVKENGKWKISHHHSSVMPEGIAIGKGITETQVRNLFHLWNDALATNDSSAVADRYSKTAVLLPTVSDVPRTDRRSITNYFDNFLKLKPQGTILQSKVVIGTNWAQDAGIYEFEMGATGDKVKARYSFIYVYEDGQWKISHHHSSQMPEEIAAKIDGAGKQSKGQPITDAQVRGLFNLWNDALATLDPKKVAARYAKKSILLATVSDQPRKTNAEITDYFVNFLKRKPQGVITDGVTFVGENWAQDAGVYEFTMGDTGEKVKARYSFIYVWEDGEWKISHHHSSVMPEGVLAAVQKVKEMEMVGAK